MEVTTAITSRIIIIRIQPVSLSQVGGRCMARPRATGLRPKLCHNFCRGQCNQRLHCNPGQLDATVATARRRRRGGRPRPLATKYQ